MTGLLREAGWRVNKKRVERIWRREGLKVPVRQLKQGRTWFNDGSCVRLRPEYPNHVWAYDFVADRTHDGRAYRMLTVIDEFSRECLAIVVGRKIHSSDDLYTSADLFIRRGIPAHIRSDNRPEFCAKAVREWLGRLGVGTLFIEPGNPWENGYIESFNGKLRDELLDREIFCTLKEASILIEQWRRHYNGVRPHSALGYRPPAPEAIAFPVSGLPSPWNSLETPAEFLHYDTGGPITGGWSRPQRLPKDIDSIFHKYYTASLWNPSHERAHHPVFLDLKVGDLIEPLTGRRWDRATIFRGYQARLAFFHRHGVSDSDLVFMHYGNKPEFFLDLLAVWSLGGCVVPIDPRFTQFEVETLAGASHPRFSLWFGNADDPTAKALSAMGTRVLDTSEDAMDVFPARSLSVSGAFPGLDKPALILFTSGTTGQPKGVVHTHRSLRARWTSLRQSLGLETFRRALCLLPTHFGHGLICNCLFPWLSGQDLYILPPFKPDVILQLGTLLDDNKITFLSSVPTVWRLALKTARPPGGRTVQRVFCGSAPLSAFLWKEIQEWAGTREVFNSYGITETGSWVAGTTVPDFTPEDGLIGEPWGAVIRVLKGANNDTPPGLSQECLPGEQGYVWINTPALMSGYFGRVDLTRQVISQGWFFTGDIGVIDDRGWLYLKGRERDEINKGGMKVHPSDIDAVAERFDKTVAVCTFGYEDPLQGENVGIAFVLENTDDDEIGKFHEWLKHHLAKHQMPQRWYLLSEIPRTSRGKVNRSDVARRCSSLSPIDLRKVLR